MMNKKGAEGDFKNVFYGLVLTALFGMIILIAVVNVGNDYSKDTSQIVGGSLSLDKFNASISNITQDTQAIKKAFEEQSIWSAIAGVVVTGVFGISKSIFQMMILPLGLVQNVLIDTLHVPAFIVYTALGLFIIGIIFAIWRLIKIGE